MEGFKFTPGQDVYIVIDGEISKHIIRGYYTKGNERIYIIVTYGRESLVTEDKIFLDIESAQLQAVKFYEEKISELEAKKEIIMTTSDVKLSEERSPKEIDEAQRKEQEEIERDNQIAVDESNSIQEAKDTFN